MSIVELRPYQRPQSKSPAHRVEFKLSGEFADRMSAMRIWLDTRHVEPAAFRYHHANAQMVIRVEFERETDAAAFAAEFAE